MGQPGSQTKQRRQEEAQVRESSGTELRQTRNAPDHEAVALVLVNTKILRVGLLVALDFFRRVLGAARALGRRAERDETEQTDYSKKRNRLHRRIPVVGIALLRDCLTLWTTPMTGLLLQRTI
jgi:hypothetical protein